MTQSLSGNGLALLERPCDGLSPVWFFEKSLTDSNAIRGLLLILDECWEGDY
ncbi:hypothetical protein HMPREF9622_00215 [Cutibacterium modestum HL037PA3]|jgi:hypothetical protein|uniref:Uncharacterized protein n=1 Tax=Cutibacterium modestum HL044PA1 TaxID=765109 RepID=A0ABP2K3F3_9ACTN|nr:hypothetical protein [Cutibacterium modestum]EFS75349.1 hypothetical protein HMPREF9621_00192 [Cutibacterium modestum HL037PA2]EFS91315.1 hypothetical protein HMPREF9607_02607 [Cutibacterium modestum HL044PA1]EFT16672.1 hypothetical protein HMPREF9622_00215 [Cutibacterium modestum HL037PA3]EGG27335.1 hypothetical protein PA08_1580 [Cutibacterium modestum P08]